ncbi:MAG TPA: hypothetical protein VEW45_01230 [Candidatus Dormibacteraeota bacterium]|nr:hypothetical protein [Candidatus Dormibacteraeota bacterium]
MSGSTPTSPRFFRWLPFAATLAALLLVLAACATASPSESAAAPSEAAAESAAESAEASASEAAGASNEITVSDTSAGPALAGEGGMTLYTFDNDTGGQSSCSGGCVENWPPFTVDGEAAAGEGVSGDIGSITRDDGATQVTYNGSPLYYFAGDQAAGDSSGDGVGGVWHIAAP